MVPLKASSGRNELPGRGGGSRDCSLGTGSLRRTPQTCFVTYEESSAFVFIIHRQNEGGEACY